MIKKIFLDSRFEYLLPLKTKCKRIGSNFDGGYVIREQDFKLIEKIVSFGMGSNHKDWSFELSFLKEKKIEILYFDHTVSVRNYLSNIFKTLRRVIKLRYSFKRLLEELLDLYKYILLIKFSKINHFKKKICSNPQLPHELNPKQILSNIENDKILLKIDIEGGEYDIIDQIIEHNNKIISILIEFHELNKFEEKFEQKIKKLKSNFEIIHLHGNNNDGIITGNLPSTIEVTLVNKKYVNEVKEKEYNYDFPINGLDFPNNSSKPDLFFSFK